MRRVLGLAAFVAAPMISACAVDSADRTDPVHTTSSAERSGERLYAAVCAFGLASFDPSLAIRFYAKGSVPSGDGPLDLAMTPLVGWDPAAQEPRPPSAVSSSATCGSPIVAHTTVSGGTFAARFGTLVLPAVGNSINGEDAQVDNVQLDGVVRDPSRFCSGFAGTLTVPDQYEFRSDENTCLFVEVSEGDPLPTLSAADFHCP
jgi:hypothetical protein